MTDKRKAKAIGWYVACSFILILTFSVLIALMLTSTAAQSATRGRASTRAALTTIVPAVALPAPVPCPCAVGHPRTQGTPVVCEVTVNVADWFGPFKGNTSVNVSGEVGYHAGSEGEGVAELKFLATPDGYHPRVLRFFADVYSIWSERRFWLNNLNPPTQPRRTAVALFAIHTRNNFKFSEFSIRTCRDCMLWLQTPVGYGRDVTRDVGHLDIGLLTRDTVWLKMSMFNSPTTHELLTEMTVSFEYCNEEARGQ